MNQASIPELLLLLVLYFLPTIITAAKRRDDWPTPVLVNVFLSWTIIGWFAALYLSLRPSEYERHMAIAAAVADGVAMASTRTEPGWYDDPDAPGQGRWWDGSAWADARLDEYGQPLPPT